MSLGWVYQPISVLLDLWSEVDDLFKLADPGPSSIYILYVWVCHMFICFIFLLVYWYSWSTRRKLVVISSPSNSFLLFPTMHFLTLKSLHNILLFHFRWRWLNYKLSWWYSWCSWWITKRCMSGPAMGGGIFRGGPGSVGWWCWQYSKTVKQNKKQALWFQSLPLYTCPPL